MFTLLCRFYPALVAAVAFINSFFIIYKGSPRLSLDKLKMWEVAIICLIISLELTVAVYLALMPILRRKIDGYKSPNSVNDQIYIIKLFLNCMLTILFVLNKFLCSRLQLVKALLVVPSMIFVLTFESLK